MAFCGQCGTKIEDGTKSCPACGAASQLSNGQGGQPAGGPSPPAETACVAGNTAQFDAGDVQQGKLMAILAYLSILVLIPLFAAKDNPFARYHTNQGLILFALEAIVGVAANVLWWILPYGFLWRIVRWIYSLCNLALFALAITGILNAANGRAKGLPALGGIRLLK